MHVFGRALGGSENMDCLEVPVDRLGKPYLSELSKWAHLIREEKVDDIAFLQELARKKRDKIINFSLFSLVSIQPPLPVSPVFSLISALVQRDGLCEANGSSSHKHFYFMRHSFTYY